MPCYDELKGLIDNVAANASAYRDNKANYNQVQQLSDLYFALFHKRFVNRSCKNCLLNSFFEIRAKLKNMDNKFALKVGNYLIDPAGNGSMDCNHRTLTDEKAIYHLRRYKGFIDKFASYPENWEQLVDGTVKEEKTDYEKLTIQELKDELRKIAYVDSDFKGKTKKELIQMINEG